MNALKSFAIQSPVLFVICLMVVWFVAALVFMGVAASVLHKPYGDTVTTTVSRLAVTACVLWLVWRLGWLETSGITQLGRWQVWALSVGGMLYFAGASLYAFYGNVAFDIPHLIREPASRSIVLTQAVVSLSEELLFRGVMLYVLLRAWGHTRYGMIGSVVLTAALFALLHTTQVFTHGVAWSSVLLLTAQTCISAVWWGALVVWGGSLWPAILLHFVINAAIPIQGLVTPMITPEILAYRRLLWFSLPLGILGIGLLAWTTFPAKVELKLAVEPLWAVLAVWGVANAVNVLQALGFLSRVRTDSMEVNHSLGIVINALALPAAAALVALALSHAGWRQWIGLVVFIAFVALAVAVDYVWPVEFRSPPRPVILVPYLLLFFGAILLMGLPMFHLNRWLWSITAVTTVLLLGSMGLAMLRGVG